MTPSTPPRMTHDLAMAAAKDAATARMRGEGRKTWNEDDYNEACRTFNRLWPSEEE